MAARDETYRNQHALDIVFAVSCVALLASMIWMFAVDHNREWKDVQRKSRDVEVRLLLAEADKELARHQEAIDRLKPTISQELKQRFGLELDPRLKVEEFLSRAKELATRAQNAAIRKIEGELAGPRVEFFRLSIALNEQRAVRDSIISERDINFAQGAPPTMVANLEAAIAAKAAELAKMERRHDELKQQIEKGEAAIAQERKPTLDKIAELDELTRKYDRLVRTAEQRRVTVGTRFRALPVLDAFAPPYKIVQHTPDGLTIDYNFKQVQRVDRCATCHVFADRPEFSKENLRNLARAKNPLALDEREIGVYAHHPRLDLFVGSNSPHPIEKFACTVCHAGQGGSTTFDFAYHFPDVGRNDGEARKLSEELRRKYAQSGTIKTDDELWAEVRLQMPKLWMEKYHRWEKENHWHADLHPNFIWDYPMAAKRFAESSCLKCHHEVTDLVRTDGQEEAPKLLAGYRLIRDNGCFGCHEISGYKQKRPIGPDMRLEPYPPVEDLTALERSRIDPNDPPGNLRKVGPGLHLVADKLDADFIQRWLRSPRSFRHDTKMPHIFGLSNNTAGKLADTLDGPSQLTTEQEHFPDAEIQAMSFYLLHESRQYAKRMREAPQAASIGQIRILRERLLNAPPGLDKFSDEFPRSASADDVIRALLTRPESQSLLTKDQLAQAIQRLTELEMLHRQHEKQAALPYGPDRQNDPYPPKGATAGDAAEGRRLFEIRGCVACHVHDGATKIYDGLDRQINNSTYGPNLSHLKEKLKNRGERWLFNWLTDPAAHHPRTFMPKPKFNGDEKQQTQEKVNLIAFLLMDSKPGPDLVSRALPWEQVAVGTGDKTRDQLVLQNLARTYLEKAIPRTLVDDALKGSLKDQFFLGTLRSDADERILADKLPPDSPYAGMAAEDRLQWYVGRKSIGRYGCYGCHDVPGFEQAKPIGTPLNDWGKKPSDRLAFDTINDFLKALFTTPHVHGNHGRPNAGSAHKPLYDAFYFDAIQHGRREGFLYQKLKEPRSYDYGKLKTRPWDDRLKMPQFKFAHTKPTRQEAEALAVPEESRSDEQKALVKAFLDRAAWEEDQAVEAVITFVLGLVAEPMPMQFVNRPKEDRLHEVRGIKILEKYNCISCHTTKAGSYEVVLDFKHQDRTLAELLAESIDLKQAELQKDVEYPSHNAWRTARPYPDGRVIIRGVPNYIPDPDAVRAGDYTFNLVTPYEAVRLETRGKVEYIRAGMDVLTLPHQPAWRQHSPTGGNYAEVMVRTLVKHQGGDIIDAVKLNSRPPLLIRQGQKVQTEWLLRFLRDPYEIRPLVGQHLKMPQFSLSDEEIAALAAYFVAVDRLENPALGIEYLSKTPPQRDPAYQRRLREEFDRRLIAAGLKPGPANDYYEIPWQIMTNKNYCLSCHDFGTIRSEGKPEQKGPPLDRIQDRLRPEYIEHWVSWPKRTLPFTAMLDYEPFHANFAPAIGPLPLAKKAAYNLSVQFVLSPPERTRAVRDALMSWGYLVDPPPTAKKVGPPQDLSKPPR